MCSSVVDIEAARRIQHGFDARDQPRRWAPLRGNFELRAGVEILVAEHLCWQQLEGFGRIFVRQVHRPAILFFSEHLEPKWLWAFSVENKLGFGWPY